MTGMRNYVLHVPSPHARVLPTTGIIPQNSAVVRGRRIGHLKGGRWVVGPAGVELSNYINGLGRPTPPNRPLFLKDNFARCPTCPTLPEAEAPLLDAWLASGDPIAWIGLIGGETIDD